MTASSTVVADYIGVSCSTGKIFDASYTTGQPVTFPLAQVIPGWQQGLVGMKVGGKRLLGIPSDLAYGPSGRDPIAPDEALWFVVELRGRAGRLGSASTRARRRGGPRTARRSARG